MVSKQVYLQQLFELSESIVLSQLRGQAMSFTGVVQQLRNTDHCVGQVESAHADVTDKLNMVYEETLLCATTVLYWTLLTAYCL